jgi:hypothetical protein
MRMQIRRLTRLTLSFSKKELTFGPHLLYTSPGTTSGGRAGPSVALRQWKPGLEITYGPSERF